MVSTRAAQERLSTGYRIAVSLLFPEQRSHQRRAADSFPARHLHAGTRPATVRHKATTAPELTLPRSGSITSGHSALFDRGRMRESPPMLCQGEERLGRRACRSRGVWFTLLTAATRIRGISACLSSGSRTEHSSNLMYCSRIQAAVCSLVHSFPHERLCQHGYLGQGINLPSCGVRLEFEASPPASEGCSWVSLETDPHTGLLSGNDITCTSKSKL